MTIPLQFASLYDDGSISGPKKTFIKKYIVERTHKTEIRTEEQKVRIRRVVGRIYGIKYG